MSIMASHTLSSKATTCASASTGVGATAAALPIRRLVSGKEAALASTFALGAGSTQLKRLTMKGQCRSVSRNKHMTVATATMKVEAKDSWISKALEVCAPGSTGDAVSAVQTSAVEYLKSIDLPNTRTEAYRFTDLLPLVKAQLVVPSEATDISLENYALEQADKSRIVLVDGIFRADLSDLSGLPAGVTVGPLSAVSAPASTLGKQSAEFGSVFAQLNTACMADAVVVVVEDGVQCAAPLHVLVLSSAGPTAESTAASHPRLLVAAGTGASIEVVEEFGGAAAASSGAYFTNAVAEIVLAEEASVKHSVVQSQTAGAIHMKATFVQQAANSSYALTEASTGSQLARHDIKISQQGAATSTTMRAFLCAGKNQLLDTHSSLVLDHPNGTSDQLHKCIAAAPTARAVFDGNVKVNKLAQKTDAQQMSRNLLLCPRATVNVKPNLQIIADDVKCTHGCTVSDLEDEELFYFQARGIDPDTARSMLVFSFGQEVVQGLEYKDLRGRVEQRVKQTLDSATN
uniref:Fe-S cluster assembly protein SufD n=1 Tax=Pyramimonas obovata TaxID=1411642 RepID=A0A7S0NAH2_9CHLO|mmetsp:Transcript_22764/g.49890  ORF Transcript_22764/g.49890 Transcript_22764/m.49890 type:complete len:517 (+) Transcript_22764:65-1615(+)